MTQSIDIELFGRFRDFGNGRTMTVRLAEAATVAELRTAFGAQLGDNSARALLRTSAFATDERVLDDAEPVPSGRTLAILPPVCGG